jgi:hypothetical protein
LAAIITNPFCIEVYGGHSLIVDASRTNFQSNLINIWIQ